MGKRMLNSFYIENFRLFCCLKIARLGRVNLLVGKNNSGKSAFLEAIELYAGNASLLTLENLAAGREETWSERNRFKVYVSPIRHLFRGHQLPKVGEPGIVLTAGEAQGQPLQIKVAPYQVKLNAEGNYYYKMLTERDTETSDYPVENTLIAQEGEQTRRIIKIDTRFVDTKFNEYATDVRVLSEVQPKHLYQSVPTHYMPSHKIADLWDAIGLTDAEDEVIAGLKLIAPTITGIGFVGSDSGSGEARIPLARTTDSPEPLPLKSMGDGMTRLFHIIVALVNARDGILLIDEFENGLHWSVQPSVWKTVFRLAARLNVQVFATTHSRDCVAGFEEAWRDSPEDGAFFRLQRDKGGNVAAQAYSLKTLENSIDTDVEVR